MPERKTPSPQKEVVRHFVFRFGAINGYRFGPGGGWTTAGHNPTNRKQILEAMDDNRRQYVTDMRWVKEAVRRKRL